MKNLLLVFGLFILLTTKAQQTNHTITVGSETRSYVRYLPSGFQASENLPVVFVLHGLGGTAISMVGTGFNLIADTARIIVYYPQGILNNWSQASWNNGTLLSSTADDIAFFNAMMDESILTFNADPSRVYVTGFSMGGIMSHHLACALNERVAAIGPMAGTMSTSDIANCVPVYPTPVIHLHGDADGTVPYNSGPVPSLSLVPQTMDFWINVHSCDGTYDSIRMPDNAPGDNITVDRFVYQNCSSTDPLELWRLNNADHVFLYQPVNDITESFEVWRFFLRFSHSDPAPASLSEQLLTSINFYPNPGSDRVYANGLLPEDVFGIYDAYGTNVSDQVAISSDMQRLQLELNELPVGLYFVKSVAGCHRVLKN